MTRCDSCPGLACRRACEGGLVESDLRIGVVVRYRSQRGSEQRGRVHEVVEPFCAPLTNLPTTRLRPERSYVIELEQRAPSGKRLYRIPRLAELLTTGEIVPTVDTSDPLDAPVGPLGPTDEQIERWERRR